MYRIIDARSFAGGKAQLQTHGFDGQQQVGENDGGIYVQNFDRLQRDSGGQIGALADFQDAVPGADFPVLTQIAARLAHEPYGTNVGGSTLARIQKAAGHGSHAHGCSVLSSQKKARNPCGLCCAAHWRPLMKYGFAHASLSMVRGVMSETESMPGAG